MLIRRAPAVRPRGVVVGQEIRHAGIVLRHPPAGGNFGVGVGHQLLDGGHRIAVELHDQGRGDDHCFRRQIGVVVMHEIVLVDRELGLRAAVLICHPDLQFASTSAATAATAAARYRQRDLRVQRRWKEIKIGVPADHGPA